MFGINGSQQGLNGDKTTTGATCISSLPEARRDDRSVLRRGDKTTPCPKCGQVGEIAEGDSSFKWHGIPTAKHNALILCGCPRGTNRLIAPRDEESQMPHESAQPFAARSAEKGLSPEHSFMAGSTPVTPGKTFARTFLITDSETYAPLRSRSFLATVDGRQITGITDDQGMARVEAPTADSSISLHVSFLAPVRELPELAAMTTRSVTTTTRVEEIPNGQNQRPITITVNDRAATREAIIRNVRALGHEFVERSDWHAKPPKKALEPDWDYSMIALHHAGRSYTCGSGADQIFRVQTEHQGSSGYDDIGYHFGIDCAGTIFEGRDIRSKGSGLWKFNTGVISIVILNNMTTAEEGGDFIALWREALELLGTSTVSEIPSTQIDAALNFIGVLRSFFNVVHFGGHVEYPKQQSNKKICPGRSGMKLVKLIRKKTKLLPPPKS
ncbi:PAAR domain-containing protein [Pseudomonas sp. NPDC090201]|uniref:PAAR domain-containing protein n=1 Tax=Pseudomonas sp. NPDC090201 TaxID=3364475 RepID=UPI0037F30BD9